MFKKINDRYLNLSVATKVILSFIVNWFYWLGAWLLAEKYFLDEQKSWGYHIFHATFMAFFMTIFSNWKKLKIIFKKK